MRQTQKRLKKTEATLFELRQRLTELDDNALQILLIKRETRDVLRALPSNDHDLRNMILDRIAELIGYFPFDSVRPKASIDCSAYQRDLLEEIDLIEYEQIPFRVYN